MDEEPLNPGRILRQARALADLTQRALAARAGTAQSVVARIEGGTVSPSIKTLARLLGAAGYSLRGELVASGLAASHMLDDVPRILTLTPEERLREVANLSRFEAEARRG